MDLHIKNIPRKEKLHALDFNINARKKDIGDEFLDKLYRERIIEKGLHIPKKKKDEVVDKNDKKYIMLLEFLNAVLKKMGSDVIGDVLEFKDVPRNDILKDEVKDVLNDYLDNIIEVFGKKEIQHYRRNELKDFIISVIRCMAFECGYMMSKKIVELSKRRDPVRKYMTIYVITC